MYGLLTKLVRSRWLDIGQVLFCVFMDRDEVEVHNHAKKERGQYPAILTEQAWSIKDLLYGIKHHKLAGRGHSAVFLGKTQCLFLLR